MSYPRYPRRAQPQPPRYYKPRRSRRIRQTFLKAVISGLGLAFVIMLIAPYLRSAGDPAASGASTQQAAAYAPGARPVTAALAPPVSRTPVDTVAPLPPASRTLLRDAVDSGGDDGVPTSAADEIADEADAEDAGARAEGEEEADGEAAAAAADDAEETGSGQPGAGATAAADAGLSDSFPKTFTRAEMDAALDPVLSYKLSDEDLNAVREVIGLVDKRQFTDARAAIARIGAKPGRSFATWYYLRLADLGASPAEIESFLEEYPLFPSQGTLAARMETALFWNDAPLTKVQRYLGSREPVTGVGKALAGDLMIARGETAKGVELIRAVWRASSLTGPVESKFMERFGRYLTDEDHELRKRAQQFASTVKTATAPAPSAAPKKPAAKTTGGARSGAKKGQGKRRSKPARTTKGKRSGSLGASGAVAAAANSLGTSVVAVAQNAPDKTEAEFADMPLPERRPAQPEAAKTEQEKAAAGAVDIEAEISGPPSGLYARVRRLRLAKQYESAWSLMRSMPSEVSDLVAPETWWNERRIHVRAALNASKPRTAYAIASGHGPLSGENLAEASFLAGWIAYRYLEDPELALKHFETSKNADSLPRDIARGAYFLGRVKRDLKRETEARREFEEAAERYYTYYGQLAIQAVQGAAPCSFRPPVHPTADQIKSFVEDDAVLAIAIARQLNLDRVVRVLLIGYARELTDAAHMTLAFELARRIAPQNFVVRIAKAALNRGFPVDAYGFPLALPDFAAVEGSDDVEGPLLHALTRQESEFNTDAKSPVGARGLMQLMPATARMVASQSKLKYDLARLTSDPAYNVTLGAAFLDSLITSYRGSYVMAVAAYNAGPGRVRQWVREFGDPRDRNIDPVDWVERIPFTETRNYVQRVLEGLQLYRCRAEQAKADVLLVQDLWRGRPDAKLIEASMSNGRPRP